MDGWMFGDAFVKGLSKPLMLVYEGKDQIAAMRPVAGAETPAQRLYWKNDDLDSASMDADLREHGGIRLHIEGTNHWNFSDRALYSPLRSLSASGPIAPQRAHAIINRYVLVFFEHTLNGTDEPLLHGEESPFPEVSLEIWAPNNLTVLIPAEHLP
jgi:hypothetical protein